MGMYTLLCLKWITIQEATVQPRELGSAMRQGGWDLGENGYRYVCGRVHLHCSPETIPILFVDQLHPNTK